jgi:hypothetical protein
MVDHRTGRRADRYSRLPVRWPGSGPISATAAPRASATAAGAKHIRLQKLHRVRGDQPFSDGIPLVLHQPGVQQVKKPRLELVRPTSVGGLFRFWPMLVRRRCGSERRKCGQSHCCLADRAFALRIRVCRPRATECRIPAAALSERTGRSAHRCNSGGAGRPTDCGAGSRSACTANSDRRASRIRACRR